MASYIEDCLQSVMRQSYQGGVECLIIDDCGTDDSIAIAERMIACYEGPVHFEILHHEKNRGLSASRNTGIENANGGWIFFLDSDDKITEDCIALLMEKAEADGAVEMVQGNVRTEPFKNIDGLTVKVSQPFVFTNAEVRKCFYQRGELNVAAWNKLVKRTFITDNNLFFEEGIIYEDTLWMFYVLKYLSRVCLVSDVTYFYHRRINSIVTSAGYIEREKSLKIVFQCIINNFSPEYEHVEFIFYAKRFAYFYSRYSQFGSGFKQEYSKWKEKAKTYGAANISLRLMFSATMAKVKYGWLLLSLLYRIEHPRVIPADIQRICYRK